MDELDEKEFQTWFDEFVEFCLFDKMPSWSKQLEDQNEEKED